MKLQNIIFPSAKNCIEEELFFRQEGGTSCILEKGNIMLNAGGKVSFDTYFNSFSAIKWLRYTKVDNVCLRLKLKGRFKIILHYKERMPEGVFELPLHEEYCDTQGEVSGLELLYDCGRVQGIYAFEITALEDDSVFMGGAYHTKVDRAEVERIKIGIIICTFRRETFVYKNMNILKETFFNNQSSDMKDSLLVYISDNAKSLDASKIDSHYVKVFPNKNVGGAGGFTRGMIECLREQEEEQLTHVLLMDDDVMIQPESIFRTYNLLRLLKPEYKNTYVGGAMMRLDKQWVQTESGAFWNAGSLISRKHGLDLREIKDCLYNEIEEKCDYNAWWYCTIPMEFVREDNLPIPIFIRGDDVEYGLRNMQNLILMNGICVWHEPFEFKFSSSMYYYIFRNRLIDNSIRGIPYTRKQFLKDLQFQMLRELFLYRYKNAKLLLEGVNDFLKGIDWLKEQDGELLNLDIIQKGYRMQNVNELEVCFDLGQYEQTLRRIESRRHQLLRKALLNGAFLKPKGDAIVPTVDAHLLYCFRMGRVLNYDFASQKGFVTRKNNKEFMRIYKDFRKLKKLCYRRYDQVVDEYRTRGGELMGLQFWKSYLEIN